MMKPVTKLFAAVALAGCLFVTGCAQSTYPKEEITEHIKSLSKSEYGLESVHAKLVGKTLGVHMTVANLFDGAKGFNKKTMEKVEDVLLVIRRVSLSTDADVDFFDLVISDTTTSLKISMSGYILDIKKALYGAISRDDYTQRMRLSAVADTGLMGQARVKRLFEYLSGKNISLSILSSSFDQLKDKESSSLVSNFFLSLIKTKMKNKSSNSIVQMRAKALSESMQVFYVQANETNKPGNENAEGIQMPEKLTYEFLVWVKVENYTATVEKILPLKTFNPQTGKMVTDTLPAKYKDLEGYKNWPENDFYVKDISFTQFLAEQIAQRVKQGVAKLETNKLFQKLITVEGEFTDRFELTFMSKEKETISQLMVDLAVKTAGEVCKNYKYDANTSIRIKDKKNKIVAEQTFRIH